MEEVNEVMRYYLNGELGGRDLGFALESYLDLQKNRSIKIRSNKGLFNLEQMEDEIAKLNFRFKKDDLVELNKALSIPEEIHLKSRCRVQGLTALCLLLRRLAYPNRLKDLEDMFGMSYAVISETIKWMTQFIYQNHGHLLQNISKSWLSQEKLESYCLAISETKNAPLVSCWGFIDGTARRICRPTTNQQDYYSGHKRFHCLKYQSISAPDGIIVSLHGAYKGRRHDAGIFRESQIYNQLKSLNQSGSNYVMYGDPAYPVSDVLISPFRGARLTAEQQIFNVRMSKVRQAVEWGFQKICTIFAFVDFHKNQKLLLQDVSNMYKVATILTNCHTCIYGSQTAQYFAINPPTLEEYLGW